MTIGNSRGAKDIIIQDQSDPLIDLHLTNLIDTGSLTAVTAIDDVSISIEVTTLPVVGDIIVLKETNGIAFYQGGVTAVTATGGDGYDIDLDTPLDFAYQLDAGLTLESNDLAVNGSVTTQEFSISPVGLVAGAEWHIVRVACSLLSVGPMDDGLFGDLTALTKGVVFRSVDEITKNIYNAKTNGMLKEHAYDLTYATKAPSGQFGLTFRRTFGGQEKNGVVVKITANANGKFSCLVQDNLTGLISFRIVVQGHVVDTGVE